MPRSSIGSGEGVCVYVGVNMGKCGMCGHEYACVGVWPWMCLCGEEVGGRGGGSYLWKITYSLSTTLQTVRM